MPNPPAINITSANIDDIISSARAAKRANFEAVMNEFIVSTDKASQRIKEFMDDKKAASGSMNLTPTDSLVVQRLMNQESILVNVGTNAAKTMKDNIIAAARNI